jgi:hypothetical protein
MHKGILVFSVGSEQFVLGKEQNSIYKQIRRLQKLISHPNHHHHSYMPSSFPTEIPFAGFEKSQLAQFHSHSLIVSSSSQTRINLCFSCFLFQVESSALFVFRIMMHESLGLILRNFNLVVCS